MKIDGLTHPKTKELAFTLEIPLPHAIGLLELLWAFVAQQTPQGNIGKWSNQVIAGEAGWQGDADRFIDALISVGFLDENEDHRLLVHDWSDHAPNWVHAKLKKKGRSIIGPDLSADLRESQDPPPEATTSLAKPSQAKGERRAPDGDAPPPKKSKSKRGERIPEDFPTDDDLLWATQEFPSVDHNHESAKFRDYWISVPGQKGCKLDWPATWRNWIRRAAENGKGKTQSEPNPPSRRVLN